LESLALAAKRSLIFRRGSTNFNFKSYYGLPEVDCWYRSKKWIWKTIFKSL